MEKTDKEPSAWEILDHQAERRDGLVVTLAHPAIWPIAQADRPMFAAQVQTTEDEALQAPLRGTTLQEALAEADRLYPFPAWRSSAAWRGAKNRRGRRARLNPAVIME
ncbi:hypothetical protein L6R46_06095 [Myxococcota bacterium]|nr:hypothetical protein [Myxococcota bacterium]